MHWVDLPEIDGRYVYAVDRVEDSKVVCSHLGRQIELRFAAADQHTLNAYRRADFVLVHSRVGNPEPLRKAPHGWQIWRPPPHSSEPDDTDSDLQNSGC
jgi:hypothetical protein